MGVDVHDHSSRIEKQLGTKTGDYSGPLQHPPLSRIEALIYEIAGKLETRLNDIDKRIETYKLKLVLVDELPEKGDTWTIYFIKHPHNIKDKSKTKKDYYDEYYWFEDGDGFELIGNTDIDLSQYPKFTDLNSSVTASEDSVLTEVVIEKGVIVSHKELNLNSSVEAAEDSVLTGVTIKAGKIVDHKETNLNSDVAASDHTALTGITVKNGKITDHTEVSLDTSVDAGDDNALTAVTIENGQITSHKAVDLDKRIGQYVADNLDSSVAAEEDSVLTGVTITDGKISAHTETNLNSDVAAGEHNVLTGITIKNGKITDYTETNLDSDVAASDDSVLTGITITNGKITGKTETNLNSDVAATVGHALTGITIKNGTIIDHTEMDFDTECLSDAQNGVISGFTVKDGKVVSHTEKVLENVALSGSYKDLSDVPTKVSEFENDSDYATNAEAQEKVDTLDKTLAVVAKTGSYPDLLNKPVNVSEFANDADYATKSEAQGYVAALDEELSTVAKSGSYKDLTDVPTKVSEFENDSNFATKEEVAASELNTTYTLEQDATDPHKITFTGSDGSVNTIKTADTVYDDTTVQDAIKYLGETKADQASLSAVALSGSYNDLSEVPTKVSEFENDSNYATKGDLEVVEKKIPIDTNTTYTLEQDAEDGHKIALVGSDGTRLEVVIPDVDIDTNTTYTLELKGNKISLIPSEGTAMTFDIPIQDISGLATKEELKAVENKIPKDTNTTYVVTKGDVDPHNIIITDSDGNAQTVTTEDTVYDDSALKTEVGKKANDADLSKVAKSGSYKDLKDTPTLGALAAKDSLTASDVGALAADGTAKKASTIDGLNRVTHVGNWGTRGTTGTSVEFSDGTGGGVAFIKDLPVKNQMSMIIDGTVYTDEGKNDVRKPFWNNIQNKPDFATIKVNNASTADKLKTARELRVDLSSSATASFDGSADANPGVTGTLGVMHGGTGASNTASARTNLGLGSVATINTDGNASHVLKGDGTWGEADATVKPGLYSILTQDVDSTVKHGNYSVVAGNLSRATADYSVGIGYGVLANGKYAAAFGSETTASGEGAFATGCSAANGDYSVAMGSNCYTLGVGAVALGYESSAEETGAVALGQTTAHGRYQLTFGRRNIPDTTHIEIVGWGTDDEEKNIRTLDSNGNEVLAGKLTVGTAPTADMDVATKKYVDEHSGNTYVSNTTNEVTVGTWIDGTPIYKKMLKIPKNTLLKNSVVTANITGLTQAEFNSIDYVINAALCTNVLHASDGDTPTKMYRPFAEFVLTSATQANIVLAYASYYTSGDEYVFIDYTKKSS